MQQQNNQITQLRGEIKSLRDEIGRLKRIANDFIELKRSLTKFTHLSTPDEFSKYLSTRPIVDGEIIVENVVFDSSMFGFTFPAAATRLSFVNSIAPANMARFFSRVVISESIDLTGLDMSNVVTMSKCFLGVRTKQLKITPRNAPQGLISIAYLCSHSEVDEIIVENLLNVSITNAVEAFADSTVSLFTLLGRSQLNHSCSLAKMFASSHNLEVIDLSNLYGSTNDLSLFIADCSKLRTLNLSNLTSAFCQHVDNFAFNSTNLQTLMLHPSFIAEQPLPTTTLVIKNRDSSEKCRVATVRTAEKTDGGSWIIEVLI